MNLRIKFGANPSTIFFSYRGHRQTDRQTHKPTPVKTYSLAFAGIKIADTVFNMQQTTKYSNTLVEIPVLNSRMWHFNSTSPERTNNTPPSSVEFSRQLTAQMHTLASSTKATRLFDFWARGRFNRRKGWPTPLCLGTRRATEKNAWNFKTMCTIGNDVGYGKRKLLSFYGFVPDPPSAAGLAPNPNQGLLHGRHWWLDAKDAYLPFSKSLH